MTCIMDPVYQPRPQPMWGPQPAAIPQLEMEYYITHPPFTSPPATPMTPVTPHHVFNPPHYETAMTAPPAPYHPPPPQQLYPPVDYRLYALCQHLLTYLHVPETHIKGFWDQFMLEYFTENATLTIEGDLGEGQRKYCLTQQWIQWYFKSMMESGVVGLGLKLNCMVHTYAQSLQQLDCSNAIMETDIRDISRSTGDITKVTTSGTFIVDFTVEEKPRIISWYFLIQDCQEFVPRNSLTGFVDDKGLVTNMTIKGLLPSVHELLMRVGVIGSPLQESVSMPICTASPSSVTLSNHWQDTHLSSLNHTLGGGVALPPHSLHHSPHPPPLPPLVSCSVATSMVGPDKGKSPCTSASSHIVTSKKAKAAPPNSTARNQFIFVAAEAMTLLQAAEEVVPGADERVVTKVDNSRPADSPLQCSGSDHSSAVTPTQEYTYLASSLPHPPSLSWNTDGITVSTPGPTLTSAK